jgi:hypothetical protein
LCDVAHWLRRPAGHQWNPATHDTLAIRSRQFAPRILVEDKNLVAGPSTDLRGPRSPKHDRHVGAQHFDLETGIELADVADDFSFPVSVSV